VTKASYFKVTVQGSQSSVVRKILSS